MKSTVLMKKNYYIIFDTNVVWGEPLQKDFLEFKKYISSTGLKIGLYLPETVKEEFKKKILFKLRGAVEKYQFSINALKKFDYLQVQNGKKIEIDEDLIKKKLDILLKDNGLEIIPVPYAKINWEKLLEQAVYYLPPFEQNEKGFKDSIIAETILAAIESFDDNSTKIFVCNDKVLRNYIASKNKELLIYESIKDLESKLRADIQKIGNIDELVKQADELFYVEIHDINFFGQGIDFKSYLYDKFPSVLKGYNISYDTTDPLPEIEKYLGSIAMLDGEAIKIKGNPLFVKKEGNVFFWESNVSISRNFFLSLSELKLVNGKIEYDLNFTIKWKAVIDNSKLVKPELIDLAYIDHTVTENISRIIPGVTNFNIYPSIKLRGEVTYR